MSREVLSLRSNFHYSTSLNDRCITFAQLRSKFSIVAENVTKVYRNDSLAKSLSLFLDRLGSSLLSLKVADDLLSARQIFENAVDDTFAVKKIVQKSHEVRTGPYENIDCEEFTKDDRKGNHMHEDDGSQTEPNKKKRRLVDPQKRRDTRFSGGANIVYHKTTESRRSRSAASKSVPAEL